MSNEISIQVKDLTKEFVLPHKKHNSLKQVFVNLGRRDGIDKRKVLDNISFEVKKGEFFGIVGRNGSGKSTLLKLLAGVYVPTKGDINIIGSLTPFIELGVGFNPELTGRENVFLNGALLGFTHKQMDGMYKSIVDFAELHDFMDQKLKNYSSGMQVRLAFSIAIRAQSDILLIDEVLAVGDAAFQQKCYNHFEDLKSQKKTVVFVSHDMGAVRRFCNQAIYIDEGELTKEGSPFEIADLYLEENMESNQKPSEDGGLEVSSNYKIESKISNQTNEGLVLKISYKSIDKDELFIGMSILKDGISVADISTNKELKLIGSGKISYSLNTRMFNGGVYEISVALFKKSNSELIDVEKNRNQFIIKRNDSSRGAALRLPDGWKYD